MQGASPSSTLTLYRQALGLRRERIVDAPRTVEWLEVPGREDVLAYRRGDVVVATNFGTEPCALPRSWGSVLLRSDGGESHRLAGSSTAWLHTADVAAGVPSFLAD